MTEARAEVSMTEETAPCAGKQTGHVPGERALTTEIGELGIEAQTIWESLREGLPLVLLCEECGVPLSVSLTVRVKP